MALSAGTATASSIGASQPRKVSVPQGVNPARIKGAKEIGAASGDTPLTVSFVLKARNLYSLETDVSRGWTGPYLTTARFAEEYGQSPAVVDALESYLAGYGIISTADADRLDVTAKGTAAEFDKALSVGINDYSVPARGHVGAQRIYASPTDPSLSLTFASHILSILGLSNYAPFVSQAVPAIHRPARADTPADSIPSGERTPADFESEYGLTSLDSRGHLGQGQTLGIVTLASVTPSVAEQFWKILGLGTKANRISLDNIDGGAGPVSLTAGSAETTLDVEQSGAIAPQSGIVVYQAPNTDYGFVDAFFAAASQNTAGSVSTSWGESETYLEAAVATGTESATYAETFDEVFLEMAAQGQSSFVASGDGGAYQGVSDLGTTALAVDNPADSPYTTAAGGTTNPGIQAYDVADSSGATTAVDQVDIPEQLTWGSDYLWPLYAAFGASNEQTIATAPSFESGGGGGYSTLEPRPSYQDGVRGVGNFDDYKYLTPTDETSIDNLVEPTAFSFTGYPSLGAGTSASGRALPDLSFDADPQTGYAVYDPQFEAAYGATIVQYGGTSFVAPQLNAVTAVYASALRHRVGFWNPVIYAAARSTGSPFTPIDINQQFRGQEYLATTSVSTGLTTTLPGSFSSDNLYYAGTPATVYNPGSGLGYANLGQLEAKFATG
jgi:kumamolisin